MRASSSSITNLYSFFRRKPTHPYLPFPSRNFFSSFQSNTDPLLPQVSQHLGTFSFSHHTSFDTRAKEDEFEVIKSILVKHGWDLHAIILDDSNIVSILNDLFHLTRNAQLVFYLFNWCENRVGPKLGLKSVCTMIYILVCGNMNHKAMNLILYLVVNNDTIEHWHYAVFDVLEETVRDSAVLETVFSMLVSCYVAQKRLSIALELVRWMKMRDIFLSMGVCNKFVKALLESKKMELAWKFAEMHIGKRVNASIVSLFIRHYCVEGNVGYACKVLVEMGSYGFKPDIVAYTIVIDALCKIGFVREAASLLFRMMKMDMALDSVSISSAVDGYCKIKSLEEAMDVLKFFRVAPNIFVYNSFITKLCTDGNLVKASELFHEMFRFGISPDCCSYTNIISGYCKVGKSNKALTYLGQMLKRGFKPAVATYTVLIDSYCKLGELEMAENLFGMIERDGLKPDIITYNTLMDGYGKKGHLHKAFELLDMMRLAGVTPDVTTYNIIIHGLVKRGFVKESRVILDELIRRGFSPDTVSFTSIIAELSKEGIFEEAFLVWSLISKHGMRPDVVTCSALLNGYCKKNRMEEANVLFRNMLDAGLVPDLILYNTLIDGFCRLGNIHDACHLLNMMAEHGILPNYVTFWALVRGFEKECVPNPAENVAIKMHTILSKNGFGDTMAQYISSLHQSSPWDPKLHSEP